MKINSLKIASKLCFWGDHKNSLNNFYHPSHHPSYQVWWPYAFCGSGDIFLDLRRYLTSWSRRSLSRYGLLEHILCEWQLMRHYFEWVWVILCGWDIFWVVWGEWGWMRHYFGWVGVSGALFCVNGGGWENVLGE